MNGLIAKYDIAPADIFSDRGDGYSDFLKRCATKGMIKSYISDHAGVLSAKERMHGAFEDFWIEAALAVNSVHTDMGIAEFAIKFTNLLVETLEPLGILDQFQCQGVFANWWEHSYTVREYNLTENCAKIANIAFTGTPITKTVDNFGGYIDTYTMRQAEEDGIVVEIKYEGRATDSEITDHDAMNHTLPFNYPSWRDT